MQYDVPTGDAEEEAIASRALHSKEHKDFADCKRKRVLNENEADSVHSEEDRARFVLDLEWCFLGLSRHSKCFTSCSP